MELINSKDKILRLLCMLMMLISMCFCMVGCSQDCPISADTNSIETNFDVDWDSENYYVVEYENTFTNDSDEVLRDIQIEVDFTLGVSEDYVEVFTISELNPGEERHISCTFRSKSAFAEVDSVCVIINGERFDLDNDELFVFSDLQMFMGLGFIFVAVIVISVVLKKFKVPTGGSVNTSSKPMRSNKSISLEHSDCDTPTFGQSCLHIDTATEEDEEACQYCGFVNQKGAKRCSTCGARLKKK